MTDLKERLKKLGFSAASTLPPPIKKNIPLEKVVGGRRIVNSQGEIIVTENLYPFGSKYGAMYIKPPDNNNEIHKFLKGFGTTEFSTNKIFIDTETTGLNSGTGTIPFLIGYGFFDQVGFRTFQLLLENPVNEMAQLMEFSNAIQNFQTTVTFNGKSFDLPLIKTRYLINKMDNPLNFFSHIDLLHISRKLWKMRLADRSLKELEARIINFTRDTNDVPGWLIPQLYFDYLRTNDGTQLKQILYHNEIDIVSMAVLYEKINEILCQSLYLKNLDPLDAYSLAKMYLQIGETKKSILLYEQCEEFNGFDIDMTCNIHNELADIYKRQSQLQLALPQWIFSAERGSYIACIELAKYFEHNQQMPHEAEKWAKLAIKLIEKSSLPKYKKLNILKEILVRANRLKRRIESV